MQKILQNTKALAVEFLPCHLKDVANIEVMDLIDIVLPDFEWMYLPKYDSVFEKAEIVKKPSKCMMSEKSMTEYIFLERYLKNG